MSIDPRLDPEIIAYLEKVQATLSTAHTLSAADLRETLYKLRMPPSDVQAMHEVQKLEIPAPHGSIACNLYKPVDRDNLPLLVWFHGGGWVLGDLDSADMPCRDLAAISECLVLSVDYRLAPEHRFPAAFDDCVCALRWAFENATALGADDSRIAVGGDSAGANLATCTCIATKELDTRFQLLVYPVIEADFSNLSYTENADGHFLTRNLMKWFWDQYIPDAANREDARVAPLGADLRGLPPAWVLTVQFDPLRDEGVKYAAALAAAGVPVETAQSEDTVHGFFTMPITASRKARAEAAKKLKTGLS